MMEAVRTSETSVDNYFTRQYIPKDNSERSLFYSHDNKISLVVNEPHLADCERDGSLYQHITSRSAIPPTACGLCFMRVVYLHCKWKQEDISIKPGCSSRNILINDPISKIMNALKSILRSV
jgi:hypothetical protein